MKEGPPKISSWVQKIVKTFWILQGFVLSPSVNLWAQAASSGSGEGLSFLKDHTLLSLKTL